MEIYLNSFESSFRMFYGVKLLVNVNLLSNPNLQEKYIHQSCGLEVFLTEALSNNRIVHIWTVNH